MWFSKSKLEGFYNKFLSVARKGVLGRLTSLWDASCLRRSSDPSMPTIVCNDASACQQSG